MSTIDNVASLRTLYRQPGEKALNKVVNRLDDHCRRFIGQSPFCILGTATPDGEPDLSPRGGDPGFVHIADDHTLLLADRPGNNRLDTLSKLAANPSVSILFMVPGIDETLRVYGTVTIEETSRYADLFLTKESKSTTVIRVDVSRAMFHCPKALIRSRLWDPSTQLNSLDQPTISDIVNDQIGLPRPVVTREEYTKQLSREL